MSEANYIEDEVQVVFLGIGEIYALEELVDDLLHTIGDDLELMDENERDERESLKIASRQLYQSRHYRDHYDASCFERLSFEEREALEKFRKKQRGY